MSGAAILPASTGWILLGLFSIVWVLLGFFWGRKSKGLEGHMLAGRNVGLALGTATAVATWVTSNTTMLAPQFALQMGLWGMLAYATASIGLFLFAPVAERVRALMPSGFSSAEFIRLRYGRWAWGLFLAISFVYAFVWLVSMGIAGGLLLEALSGIPYRAGMSVVLAVCTLYTVVGGMKAVIGTDFVQSFIILVGIVVVGVALVLSVDLGRVYDGLAESRPMLVEILVPAALMTVFNNLLFGMSEIFHSNVWWSRAFSFRPGVGRKAYNRAGLIWLPIPIAAGFVALAAPALGVNVPQVNMVGPLVTAEILGPVGAVFVFVVVFSSIASSIDSLLAATADLFTKEIVGELLVRDAKTRTLARAATWVIVGLGVSAWAVCMVREADLAAVLFWASPFVASALWPIIAGVYWSRTTGKAAICAMVFGSVAGLVGYYVVGWYVAALIATAVSMVITVLMTWLWPGGFSWALLRSGDAPEPEGVARSVASAIGSTAAY